MDRCGVVLGRGACLLQQQRPQDAQMMAATFNAELPFAAAVVCPQFIQNPYGATLRSA
jgi:hypothetical protein